MLQFEETPLYIELRKVLASEEKPTRFENKAIIHTEVSDFEAMKVVSLDIVRDYKGNIGDQILLEFMLPLGDYIKDFYPYRDNIELSLLKIRLQETGEATKSDVIIKTERFKMIFLPDQNKQIRSSEYDQIDKFSLNLVDVLNVKVQLMDRSLEPLRIKTTGGTFSGYKNGELIHAILGNESRKILVDGKPAIERMDVAPTDNTEPQKHVVIPHGTLITSLPTFLQEKMNGVYNAGVGNYLQTYKNKRTWFVYPLYNPTRFDTNVPRVIFYSIPRNRYPSLERTYRVDGDITHILTTSGKSYKDSAETDFINDGVGFRLSDARPFMKKPVAMTPIGPVGTRHRINHEVAVKSRRDGLNYAPFADRDISSNPYAQYSRVNERNGGRVDLIWENANPEVIYPCIPCKYVFIDDTEIKEQKGIILFNQVLEQMDGEGITRRGYTTTCFITIFVEGLEYGE